MDFYTVFGYISGGVTVVGFVYSVLVASRAERHSVVYEVSEPLALALASNNTKGHRLSIIYEKHDAPPVQVSGVYWYRVRIGNLGRKVVKREDLAPKDPLRLVIEGGRVLDISVLGVSREAINFRLGEWETQEDVTHCSLLLDFLDHTDAVSIRVLTDCNKSKLTIQGTVMGMRDGIRPVIHVLQQRPIRKFRRVISFLTGICAFLAILPLINKGPAALGIFGFFAFSLVGGLLDILWPDKVKWKKFFASAST